MHDFADGPCFAPPPQSARPARDPWLLTAAAAAAVVYLTCLPTLEMGTAGGTAEVTRFSIQDTVQNILLYIPLGFFATLALRGRALRPNIILVVVVGGAALLAALAESLQASLPGRVSSHMDVLCNAGGAGLGALAGVMWPLSSERRWPRRWRERVRAAPIGYTIVLLVLGYAGLNFVPFELDLTPGGRFGLPPSAALTALTPSRTMAWLADAAPRARVDHWLDVCGNAGCLLVIGFMSWWALCRELRCRTLIAGITVLWLTLCVTGTVLIGQLFIRHARFNALCLTANLFAAGFGLGVAAVLKDRVVRWRGALCLLASTGCVALIAGRELNPFEFIWPPDTSAGGFAWIPLRRTFHTVDALHASGDLLARAGQYSALGALLGWSLAAEHGLLRRRWWFGLGLCAAVATILELIQLACPSRSADITHILFASGGAAIGLALTQTWLSALCALRHRDV